MDGSCFLYTTEIGETALLQTLQSSKTSVGRSAGETKCLKNFSRVRTISIILKLSAHSESQAQEPADRRTASVGEPLCALQCIRENNLCAHQEW